MRILFVLIMITSLLQFFKEAYNGSGHEVVPDSMKIYCCQKPAENLLSSKCTEDIMKSAWYLRWTFPLGQAFYIFVAKIMTSVIIIEVFKLQPIKKKQEAAEEPENEDPEGSSTETPVLIASRSSLSRSYNTPPVDSNS